jgi:hypothetical protein
MKKSIRNVYYNLSGFWRVVPGAHMPYYVLGRNFDFFEWSGENIAVLIYMGVSGEISCRG